MPLALAGGILGAGLVILAQDTWYPTGDLAQANLRLLSFWDHTPLVGAAGRIVGEGGVQGNHPGPLLFWFAWPLWQLLGGSSWALTTSVAVTNFAGAAVSVGCARRIGGPRTALAIGAVALVLVAGFGPDVMYQPWNPSMPLMWFLALVIATWGATTGRMGFLPVVAGTASYVIQCHAGYLLVAVALGALSGGWVLVGCWRSDDPGAFRRAAPWLAAAVAVTAVMWVPAIVDQLRHDPGNLDLLRYSFTHPDANYLGLGRALQIVLLQLDPTAGWVRGEERLTGSPVAGVLLITTWLATRFWARSVLATHWRRLDVVLAVSIAGAWLSVSRIFGLPFVYLFKWVWVLCGLVVVATGAHVVALARDRFPSFRGARGDRVVLGGIGVIVVVGLASGLVRYNQAERPAPRHSDTVAALIGPTEQELSTRSRYLVEWDDPASLGAIAFGMILELERRGFDVGVNERYGAGLERHRVRSAADVDSVLTIATGEEAIERSLARPGADLVARVEPRSEEERARADMLMERVIRRLTDAGHGDLAASLRGGGNVVGAALDEDLPDDVNRDLRELLDLFLPTAVVLSPLPDP